MSGDELIEISKSRLALLEGQAKLQNELWNDPTDGMTIKEIVKKKYPNANIPELDAVREVRKSEADILTKVEAKEKALESRIEAFEKAQKEKEERDVEKQSTKVFEAEVEATKKKYQLSPEGMEKVFARMKEKNNPDVEAAAAWVTDHAQAAAPTGHSGYNDAPFNPYGAKGEDKDWELLNKNPWDGKFAEQEISRIQRDFANGRGHVYGQNGMGGEL